MPTRTKKAKARKTPKVQARFQLPEKLWLKIKVRAARQQTSMSDLAERYINAGLSEPETVAEPEPAAP